MPEHGKGPRAAVFLFFTCFSFDIGYFPWFSRTSAYVSASRRYTLSSPSCASSATSSSVSADPRSAGGTHAPWHRHRLCGNALGHKAFRKGDGIVVGRNVATYCAILSACQRQAVCPRLLRDKNIISGLICKARDILHRRPVVQQAPRSFFPWRPARFGSISTGSGQERPHASIVMVMSISPIAIRHPLLCRAFFDKPRIEYRATRSEPQTRSGRRFFRLPSGRSPKTPA